MQHYGTLKRSTLEIPKGASFSIRKSGNTAGYDGHALRAFAYFGDQMPDITDTVESSTSPDTAKPTVPKNMPSPA